MITHSQGDLIATLAQFTSDAKLSGPLGLMMRVTWLLNWWDRRHDAWPASCTAHEPQA
jgi:hypothetical protein